MKHSIKTKILCSLLSALLIMQIVPFSTFAVEETTDSSSSAILTDNIADELPNIVCEVIGKRTEYTKEYLLGDGSFYSITSPVPIHVLNNGKWENIQTTNENLDSINTIDEATAHIQENAVQSYSLQRTSLSENEESSFIINKSDGSLNPGGGYKLGSTCEIFIKPSTIGNYLGQNRLITYAGVSFNGYVTLEDENPVTGFVIEQTCSWDENTLPSNYDTGEYAAGRVIDTIVLSETSTFTCDITSLYSQWDSNVTANNGFVFMLSSYCQLVITNPCITVRYFEIDESDLDFTYHSLDMGNAGTLYINDCTNTIRVEQDLMSLNFNNSEFIINRTYNSTSPSYENFAGIGFNFNYESSIELTDSCAVWNMFNGLKTHFIASRPLVEENNYQKWVPINNDASNSMELWVKNSEIENITNVDYRNLYIVADNLTYNFNQLGTVISMKNTNSNNNVLTINYENDRISEVVNFDNSKYKFTYEESNIGYTYISLIEALSSTDELLSKFEFTTTYDSVSQTTTHITKCDSQEISKHIFDFYGNLIGVYDLSGNYYKLEYTFSGAGNLGTRLIEYSVYYLGNESYNDAENDSPNKNLIIDSNDIYQRVFTDEKGYTELLHYDRDFKLVVYRDTDGVYHCVEYDNNDLISSFVFSSPETSMVLNNTFEKGTLVGITNWTKNNTAISRVTNQGRNDNYSLSMSAGTLYSGIASQVIKDTQNANVIFEADKTFVVGGWIKSINTIPKEDRFVGIVVEAAPLYDAEGNEVSEYVYNECTTIAFDTCVMNEWQFRMKPFKLATDSYVRIKLVCENQINTVYFDDITLYASEDCMTNIDGIVTSSPIEYTYTSEGLIGSEMMTWTQESGNSLSMGTSYTYQNGKLSEYKDINNNSTFYNYNSESGVISEIGHIKDDTGTILDATTVEYDMNSLLKSTSIVINSIVPESNDYVESEGDTGENNETTSSVSEYIISTDYDIASEGIVGVTHNGVKYCFEYNNDGTLNSVHAEQVSTEDGTTTSETETDNEYSENGYSVDYTYNTEGDISVIDYSNNYRVKHISTEDETGKTLTIECYNIDSEMQSETLIKSYVYNFNNKGEITQVYDSGTGITIVYDGDDYSINETDGLLYQKTTDDNGNTVESYTQAYFDDPNNTDEDTITQTPTVTSYGENDVEINTSTVCINKNVDDFVSTFNYTRSSVTDYFNRIVEKETILDYSRPRDLTGKTVVNTEYSYQELGDNKTSGLVSEYTSTISKVTNSNTTALSSYNRKYEYDNKGNISFVYTETNDVITPKNYYEYDNANQLITEIDFEKQLCAHYTYNAGGNLTAKIYYKYSELVFDVTNRKITTWGSETSRITYGYDNIWTDRLTNYNGTQINYDKMGNPLNFVGIDHDNAEVTGTLEWSGDLLTAFETTDDRYTYQYDVNGYRTSKTVYEKETDSDSNYYWREIYTMRYIWENGVLTGMTYSSLKDDGTRHPEQNINLIYDEKGAPVGYVTMLGVPYYFNKDINENVLSLIYTDGTKLCSFSYDSWGLPKATYHGENILVQAIAKLTAVFCPVTYHGYLYDYETGLYFSKGRCYSPSWGRYLNPEDPVSLTENSTNPLDANLYLFCNNNTVNNTDKTASWSRNYNGVIWTANGFDVEMSKIFSSRAFCSVFAGQIIKTYGSWDLNNGYNYQGMNSLRVASDLFAHCIGKYAQSAINKVNTCWGDGWILNNSKSNTICIRNDDENAWKYEKIWFAASALKAYAQKDGIYIVL